MIHKYTTTTRNYFLGSTSICIIMKLLDLYDNIGPKLKKPSFAILGAYNVFKNRKNDRYYGTEPFFPFLDKRRSYIPIGLFFYLWTNLGPFPVELIFKRVLDLYSSLFYAPY